MIKQIVKEIKKHEKIALFHHVKPDGDSISSSYGLLLAIKKAFPNKHVVFVANIEYLREHFAHLKFDDKLIVSNIDESYLTIVGDTQSKNRVEYYDEYLRGVKRICFDHHQDAQNIDAHIFWQEKNWDASAIQATQISRKLLKKNFTEEIAFFLSIGLLTDTNNFQYSLADRLPLDTFSFLMQFVSDDRMNALYNAMRSRTKADVELTKVLLDSIKFAKHTSYLIADKKMISEYGAFDVKQKVNLIGNIVDYPMWVLFIESDDKPGFKYEVSIRSNSLNINQVAVKHNGGGHLRASGAKAVDLNEVEQIIKDLDMLVAA